MPLQRATQKVFFTPMQVQYVLHLLPYTDQNDIQLHAKHFAINADQILQSLFLFDPSSCSGLEALAECKPHLSQSPTRKSQGQSDLENVEARKWMAPSQSITQAAAYSRMLSSHCGCMVALHHVEEQHLVCLKVAEALNTTPTCHDSHEVTTLHLCCTL
jgi:hypothetical protein